MTADGRLYIPARVLVASVFMVLGGERLLIGTGLLESAESFSAGVLIISALELLAGVLVAIGIQVRWIAAAMAILMLIDAVASHPFWSVAGAEAHGQLLHFAKNISIVGGLLLLVTLDRSHRDGTT